MAGIGIGISPYMSALRSKGAKPPADTSLTVIPISNTAFTLTWELPASPNVSKVIVEGSADGLVWETDKTLGAVETVDITGLENNTLRYFRLVLVGPGGYRSYGVVKSATTFDDMSQAYFTAMTTQLTAPQKAVINAAMVATSAQLAKLDCVMLSLATEQQSLLWLNDPTKTATKVNSPTFTAYKGWNGSATNYINTGFNPGDGGTYKLIRDNATIGFYSNNIKGTGSRCWASNYFGSNAGLSVGIYTDNLRVLGEVNRDSNSSIASTTVLVKEFIQNRRSSEISASRGFNNKIHSYKYSSDPVRNEVVKCSISDDIGCLFYVGSFLTDQELSDFQDAWLPVLEHLGSDYWSNFTPTTLTATAGAGKIDLAWTLPVTTYSPYTVTNVVIQESTDNVTFTDLTTLGAVTSHSVTAPTGQTRYYKIRYVSSRNIQTINSAEAHATAI